MGKNTAGEARCEYTGSAYRRSTKRTSTGKLACELACELACGIECR